MIIFGRFQISYTYYKQNVCKFFLICHYLLYKLLVAIEAKMKLACQMFYEQKVSISKFKFLLSSLVLHCYLHSTFPLFPKSWVADWNNKTLETHTQVKPHVCDWRYVENAIIFYAIFIIFGFKIEYFRH